MLKPRLKVWAIPDVATALGVVCSTIYRAATGHNIGRFTQGIWIFNAHDINRLAWIISRRGYKGPPPWTLPGAPVARCREWFSAEEVVAKTGYHPHYLRILSIKAGIGTPVRRTIVYSKADIKRLKDRRRQPQGRLEDYLVLIDPAPQKILIDETLLSVYDGIAEEQMKEHKPIKTKGNRTANLISIYPTDEQVEWINKRLAKLPWLKKSQCIIELIQKAMEEEE